MKRHLLIPLILTSLLMSCVSTYRDIPFNKKEIKQTQLVMADYITKFPQSTLRDVYKSCFQNYFGPGHIITNRESCKQYILDEISQMELDTNNGTTPWLEPYSPTLPNSEYIRISLLYVNDSLLPIDTLVDELMRSATVIRPIDIKQWTDVWSQLMVYIYPYKDQLENFEQDSTTIAEMLQEGKYVMHHSPKFNQAYNFHYRLIRHDIFEKEIQPLLSKRKKNSLSFSSPYMP